MKNNIRVLCLPQNNSFYLCIYFVLFYHNKIANYPQETIFFSSEAVSQRYTRQSGDKVLMLLLIINWDLFYSDEVVIFIPNLGKKLIWMLIYINN